MVYKDLESLTTAQICAFNLALKIDYSEYIIVKQGLSCQIKQVILENERFSMFRQRNEGYVSIYDEARLMSDVFDTERIHVNIVSVFVGSSEDEVR